MLALILAAAAAIAAMVASDATIKHDVRPLDS